MLIHKKKHSTVLDVTEGRMEPLRTYLYVMKTLLNILREKRIKFKGIFRKYHANAGRSFREVI